MKTYKGEITLVRNNRGCYILDTIKGCSICRDSKPRGCYGDCYAKSISARYGFDFGTPVRRDFLKDDSQPWLFDFSSMKHTGEIVSKISNIDMPFVRIGEMGDPSEDWGHTLSVCETISRARKPIVIITKHWRPIPDSLLSSISRIGVCINTSISALDSKDEMVYRLEQYNRLKPFCKSVLRIVSCNFNMDIVEGKQRCEIQKKLFDNEKVIDTIFRPSKDNPLVTSGLIKVCKSKFLKSEVLASVYNRGTYLGPCKSCPDMCGVNL